ncbi:hypothetical protein ACO0LL_07110 [Undibacterium sp. TC4M20W]|uniref:hypothetical protein n=1 Tax=Undibacterium sp. TC4M20W TaxID=3413052 RepID=UPI003BEF539B
MNSKAANGCFFIDLRRVFAVNLESNLHTGEVAVAIKPAEKIVLQKAVQLCVQYLLDVQMVLDAEVVAPFCFHNCMIFLSRPAGQLQVDVAVSDAVVLDYDIKSLHLNTRYVMNEMIARAVSIYGSDGQQAFAMSFLFRDGCGLVKLEQTGGYAVNLIERVPVSLDYQVGFAV